LRRLALASKEIRFHRMANTSLSVSQLCKGSLATAVAFSQFIEIAELGTGIKVRVFENNTISTGLHWVDANRIEYRH
jgi:hypothetical protein